MYYEERFHDGRWWWRSSQDDKWTEFDSAKYVQKVAEMQSQVNHLKTLVPAAAQPPNQ